MLLTYFDANGYLRVAVFVVVAGCRRGGYLFKSTSTLV